MRKPSPPLRIGALLGSRLRREIFDPAVQSRWRRRSRSRQPSPKGSRDDLAFSPATRHAAPGAATALHRRGGPDAGARHRRQHRGVRRRRGRAAAAAAVSGRRRLVMVLRTSPSGGSRNSSSPSGITSIWRARQQSVQALATFGSGSATVTADGDPFLADALLAGPGLLETLGARAVAGRLIEAGDTRQGAAPVVVLGHALWESAFRSDRGVVGRRIRVGQVDREIVGVAPAGFHFPPTSTTEVILPLGIPAASPASRKSGCTFAIGRLKPGVPPIRPTRTRARCPSSRARVSTGDISARVTTWCRFVTTRGQRQQSLLMLGRRRRRPAHRLCQRR